MKYSLAWVIVINVATGLSTGLAHAAVKPAAMVPEVRASAIEIREERSTIDCDKKEDRSKVAEANRFTFFEKCLASEPQASK